jgi:hypothetical protein
VAHRIFQRAHITVGMQHFPRMRAFASFARLENDEKSVQSGDYLGNGRTQELESWIVALRVDVDQLVRVVLRVSAFTLCLFCEG